MKVLITGATGFIGRELGKELVRRGHKVRVMSRNIVNARRVLPFPAEIISGKEGLPGEALEGIDAVINLAGESIAEGRWTKDKKDKIRDSRVKLTSDLMRLVRHSRTKVVVSASAIGYYGDRGEETLTEESGPGSGFLAEVCRAWEAELFSGVAGMTQPPRLVAIRFGAVLGRTGGALEKLLPIFRKGLGGCIGDGKQYMSWIHIQDLVQLIVFAMENESVEGVLNGVGPEPVDNWEFTRTLAKVLGRPARMPLPSALLKLALGEMSHVLLDSQKVIPHRPRLLGFKYQFPSLLEALRDLNGNVQTGEEEFLIEQFLPLAADEASKVLTENERIQKMSAKIQGLSNLFSHWEHKQKLLPLGSGVILQDRVVFRPYLGLLGQLSFNPLGVEKIRGSFKKKSEVVDQVFRAV